MLARFRASVFPGGITVASTDGVRPPNPPEIRRAEVSGVRCSLEPARSSLWIQVPHGSGVWGRLCRPGSPCLSGRPSSSGTSQPGILPLQFFLHLLGSYWVGCRGVQGSRNTGRVTGRQRRKVGRTGRLRTTEVRGGRRLGHGRAMRSRTSRSGFEQSRKRSSSARLSGPVATRWCDHTGR